MAAPTHDSTFLRHRPETSVMRIRFETGGALMGAFARAQRESWIEDCKVDLPSRELVVRMAGGFGHTGRH